METINLELIFADMDTMDRRIDRAQKNSKSGDKKLLTEVDFLKAIKAHLESGKPVRSMELTEEEQEFVHSLFLLTDKPVIYVANIAEDEIGQDLPAVNALYAAAAAEKAGALTICARIEEEISQLSPEEKQDFLTEMGIGESGLDKLVKECYSLLGLISYLTAGPKEVRAWTITRGTKAPQAAGKIHTDFEKGFIRAEIVNYDTLMEHGSMAACKEKGLIRSEGKDYVVQDGDIVLFRFNV
ncbi:MAG: YchF family ATPase, partial [Clostridia bacterium]|nr:YchF family ATPase [Clostridia bacterium]